MNNMKDIRYKFWWGCVASLALTMSSCSDNGAEEVIIPEEVSKSPIEVTAQISDGGISAQTRAASMTRAGSYTAGTTSNLASGSKFNLGVYWNTTTAQLYTKEVTVGTSSPYATGLYWDDLGGYQTDVDMVAACVLDASGKPTTSSDITFPAASTAKDNRTINWSLGTDAATHVYSAGKDLCVSGYLSNLKHTTQAKGGTFPIGSFTTNNSTKHDQFFHVLSKITVSLTAGEGYTNSAFVSNPTVKVYGIKRSATVKLTDRTVTATGDASPLSGSATKASSATTYDVAFLAVPNVEYSGTGDFLEIEVPVADNQKNVYKVSTEKIADLLYNAVSDETTRTNAGLTSTAAFTLKSGYDYHINLVINKQKILVTAQLMNWNTVNSETLTAPIIFSNDISSSASSSTWDTSKGFDFYRATSNGTYVTTLDNDKYTSEGSKAYVYDATNQVWGISTAFYWESDSQQYYFRALYPQGTLSGNTPTTTVTALTKAEYNSNEIYWGTSKAYTWGGSNIAEGYPVHPRTGAVDMNFYPIMSMIEVIVKTTDDDYKVDLSKTATVTISGTAKTGSINLHNGVKPGATTDDYSLNFKKNDPAEGTVTSKYYGANEVKDASNNLIGYFDYIVPQVLSDDAKIQINLTTAQGQLKYEKPLKSILVQNSTTQTISEWKKGERYIYTLTVKKTGIEISAQLVDWTKKEGNADVPFM